MLLSERRFSNYLNFNTKSVHKKAIAHLCLLVSQLFCIGYLTIDAIIDLSGTESVGASSESDFLETLIVLVLIVSTIAIGRELFEVMTRNRAVEDQLKAASGAFSELLHQQFATWQLTGSERDVALLAIKGLSISDIAALRDTRVGTIKAQLNSIYRKANVNGRPQFISLFVEELMSDELVGRCIDKSRKQLQNEAV